MDTSSPPTNSIRVARFESDAERPSRLIETAEVIAQARAELGALASVVFGEVANMEITKSAVE
jgi:hypothetical protein